MLEPRPPQGHGRRLHMAPAGGQPVLPAGADQALYRRSIAPNCWSKACPNELVDLQSSEAPQSSIHGRRYPQDQNAALVTRALTTEHKLEKKTKSRQRGSGRATTALTARTGHFLETGSVRGRGAFPWEGPEAPQPLKRGAREIRYRSELSRTGNSVLS